MLLFTWLGRAETSDVEFDQSVLQRPPTDVLWTDQYQAFPRERWHAGDFLVETYVTLVEQRRVFDVEQ